MPDILVRNVDAKTVKYLKNQAKRNGRSLQAELKLLLDAAAVDRATKIDAIFAKWKGRFAGKNLTPTAELIREGREER